ncbi:hypothetical protein LQ953_03270 [Sphingomonas sp. IC-56]|uniref:hypothetical protein n=1 Tax=Sphingomonas sp. IC-56 TaxID=2898529 RepID=UPI001E2E5E01|nr:hypothetical protein [Sphingomonas sp. IC-56]MCD2323033.1 hypothetical protein [Sphingomonas sp. IC-56]
MIRQLKRLRFEYHPQPDESLAGALAAGCRDSRLVRVATALEGGGVLITKPGLVQLADPASIELLAQVMRTDVELLNAIAFATTDRRGSIMLGDLLMPRPAFDFVRRRIGPNSLYSEAYHRSAWLNRLLPYCPQSFEHLVEDCPGCGPLGWRRTRGIANCETCGKQVPASEQPPLSPDLEDDYQLAADLMSRDPAAGQRALARLPSCLRPYPRSAIVDVMLKSGVMASHLPTRWELDRLRTQPSPSIAAVVSAGARLLRAWPTSIQQIVARRMEANADDLAAYDEVRNEVRWISKYAEKEGQAILAMAFPQLDGRTVKTFSSATRFYTATEVNQRLWTSSLELGQLREADAIQFEPLPSRQRLRARYDADDVDELQRQLQAGETPGKDRCPVRSASICREPVGGREAPDLDGSSWRSRSPGQPDRHNIGTGAGGRPCQRRYQVGSAERLRLVAVCDGSVRRREAMGQDHRRDAGPKVQVLPARWAGSRSARHDGQPSRSFRCPRG